MRHLLMLAAAVSLAVGCHGRQEDEEGAAPDQGDAAVTATDTTSVPTDSTMGQVPNAVDTFQAGGELPSYIDTSGASPGASPGDIDTLQSCSPGIADTTEIVC